MRCPILLSLLVLSLSAHATILDFAGGNITFPAKPDATITATWGGRYDTPLDINEHGLGNSELHERATNDAWIKSRPLAVGSFGQPWSEGDFFVEIDGSTDDATWPIGARVFIRHSPDLTHWSSWQTMRLSSAEAQRADYVKFQESIPEKQRSTEPSPDSIQFTPRYVATLSIPAEIRDHYALLQSQFAATKPERPKFHQDVVRWILAKDPAYFSREIPFVGYVQVLLEVQLGSSRRIKTVRIAGHALVDDMVGHLTEQNRDQFKGPWNFVAEDQTPAQPAAGQPQS